MSVDPGDTRPQRYRENTVRSLVQAAQAGASVVEFDVQVRAPPHTLVAGLASSPAFLFSFLNAVVATAVCGEFSILVKWSSNETDSLVGREV